MSEDLKKKSYTLKLARLELKAERMVIKQALQREELLKKKAKLENDLEGINQAIGPTKIESQEEVKIPGAK